MVASGSFKSFVRVRFSLEAYFIKSPLKMDYPIKKGVAKAVVGSNPTIIRKSYITKWLMCPKTVQFTN